MNTLALLQILRRPWDINNILQRAFTFSVIDPVTGAIVSSVIGGLFGRSSAKKQARAASAENARNRAWADEKQAQGLYGQQLSAGAGWFDPTDADARASFDQQYAGKSRTMLPWDMNELETDMKGQMSDGYSAFNDQFGGLRDMFSRGTQTAQKYMPWMSRAGEAMGELYDGTYEGRMRQRSNERQAALDQGRIANTQALSSLRSGSLADSYRGANAASGGSTRLTGDMVRASMPYSIKGAQLASDTELAKAQDRASTDNAILDAQLQNASNIPVMAGLEVGLPYAGLGALNAMDRYITSLDPYRIGPGAPSSVIAPTNQVLS